MYVAFDPGKRTGIASFNDDGSDRSKGVYTDDNLYVALTLLENFHVSNPIKRFIVEDFRLRQDKALDLVGIEGHADRSIGAIEYAAWKLKVPITFQGSHLLSTAWKWARLPPLRKNQHPPDDLSAYAHGVHWLIINKIRRHPVLDDD